jgi:hypothetical protein
MPKTIVEHVEGNEGSYFYLHPLGDPWKLLYVHKIRKLLENLPN